MDLATNLSSGKQIYNIFWMLCAPEEYLLTVFIEARETAYVDRSNGFTKLPLDLIYYLAHDDKDSPQDPPQVHVHRRA